MHMHIISNLTVTTTISLLNIGGHFTSIFSSAWADGSHRIAGRHLLASAACRACRCRSRRRMRGGGRRGTKGDSILD
jgi:hypothetical protein